MNTLLTITGLLLVVIITISLIYDANKTKKTKEKSKKNI